MAGIRSAIKNAFLHTPNWLQGPLQAIRKNLRLWIRGFTTYSIALPFVYGPKLKRCGSKPEGRDKPHFLVLRRGRWGRTGSLGEPIMEAGLVQSLVDSGTATLTDYRYEENYRGLLLGERKLVDAVCQVKPDAIVLGYFNRFHFNLPHFAVLRTIRRRCGIPIVWVAWDSGHQAYQDMIAGFIDDLDLVVLVDNEVMRERYDFGDKQLRLWAPPDSRVFFSDDTPRDLPVSFVGTTAHSTVRREYVEYLTEHVPDFFFSGGAIHEPITSEKYGSILRRSRLALNFSHSYNDRDQFKARVLESMLCGALLLESANAETRAFFEPGVDYVEFTSKEDLREKIEYYLTHDEERERIAANGRARAQRDYGGRAFWSKIEARLKALGAL